MTVVTCDTVVVDVAVSVLVGAVETTVVVVVVLPPPVTVKVTGIVVVESK